MWTLPFKSSFKVPTINRLGKRALIITTSQSTLDRIDPDTKAVKKSWIKTGVYASEMTESYYTFLDAAMEVEIASIHGGQIPIDPLSLLYPSRTKEDWRYIRDDEFKKKVVDSIAIKDVNIKEFDIIFLAGGWGAAYDFAQSDTLADKISEAYAGNKVLASVCHGALGFIGAEKVDGTPLLKGVNITGVTNRQLKHLMISRTPKHPETELIKIGAYYACSRGKISDLFSSLVVLDKKHKIVSGQNQKAAREVAYQAMVLLV